MSDKELLKDAAKAAGIQRWLFDTQNGNVWDAEKSVWRRAWNPLIDDGDALRLAVALKIDLWFDNEFDFDAVVAQTLSVFEAEEITNNDPYAATRRAIVKTAAEIGRSKT